MGHNTYQVEVLHYLNPHLIWVQVLDIEDDFLFEQIGIYGMLPLNTTLDIKEVLKVERCSNWMPAAIFAMKDLLSQAAEVWFCPTYIDRRSSIFDDNIHKYGELIIKTSNGSEKKLSSAIEMSGFGQYDECLFHQSLTLGNIKTKLNHNAMQDIVKQIESYNLKEKTSRKNWEKSFKKQMTVYNATKHLETALTKKNLELHDREYMQQSLEKKIKDLNRCKDADELSVGRGIGRRVTNNSTDINSALLKKRLEVGKKSVEHNPLDVFIATKKYLATNSDKRNTSNTNSDKLSNESLHESYDLKSSISEIDVSSVEYNVNGNILPEKEIQNKIIENISSASLENKENRSYNSEKLIHPDEDIVCATKVKRKVKKPNNSVKTAEFNIDKEKRIAYGPPDLDPKNLTIKVVPKDILVPQLIEPETKVQESNQKTNLDDFADMDSEISFKISNVDLLKTLNKLNSVIHNDISVSDISDSEYISQKVLISKASVETLNCVQKSSDSEKRLSSSLLQRRLKLHKDLTQEIDSSVSSSSETTIKDSSSLDENKPDIKNKAKEDLDSDDDSISEIIEKLEKNNVKTIKKEIKPESVPKYIVENNVNPFKNLDGSNSVFVEKLISPILMVHTKNNNCIQPRSNLRDIPFGSDIHISLQNMSIKEPTRLQKVSWCSILRGHSFFMVSPLGSGKTMGYLPAVCRLVLDSVKDISDSVGPICIILCATARSVTDVEKVCKMFLGIDERVLACFPGVDDLKITTSLLNGCDIMVCTPPMLYRLLQADFGVDLRRLKILVFDDCERVSQVYDGEIKIVLHHVREMLKNRADKNLKVQYVVASRHWCDVMEVLSKKAPNSVVCIGSFQECVLYSKTKTTVNFVMKENKVKSVIDFLNEIDSSKRTVIACRFDEEVELLEKALTKLKYIVFAVSNTMTVQDLYNINVMWGDYEEPLLGPTLICCDGNLSHLNVTNANYLVHFSMPELFSTFCKRFSVLNDNYPSIFRQENQDVRIKILLEETNVEQLPKILNFAKRCSKDVPTALDVIATRVLQKKDLVKAENFIPICTNLLALGQCPDFWNCQERHAIVKEIDETKEWVPKNGVIAFRILHYHSAVLYSARLLSNIANGTTKKYPQTYSTLSLKMGMYFSKENNRKLQGIPKVGDICAVSIKQNFFVRCQVLKILNYQKGLPHNILINLIDEERLEVTRDVYLYHLPDDLKSLETYIVQVRLANIQPQDNDITFSDLARDHLKKITDNDENLYVRGKIALTIGNCVLVDTLEACQDLSTLSETVVKCNLKRELLNDHAQPNPAHILKLEELCKDGNLYPEESRKEVTTKTSVPLKVLPEARWAYLESDDLSCVFFASAENPGKFFVRLLKFNECVAELIADIKKYITDNPEPVSYVNRGDIVIAEYPDDCTYERARIEDIVGDNKVRCFFVDHGDWREVAIKLLFPINESLLTRIPFQAIECRLIGIKPVGEDWTDYSTNWLCDNCFDNTGKMKPLYVKYFTKSEAECTGGHKYGVVMIDTNSDKDIILNKLMIDLNLTREHEGEMHYLNDFENNTNAFKSPSSSIVDEDDSYISPQYKTPNNNLKIDNVNNQEDISQVPLKDIFLQKPIRSRPLVDSRNSDDDCEDKWDINMDSTLKSLFKPLIAEYAASKGVTVDNLSHEIDKQSKSVVPAYEKVTTSIVPNKHETFNGESLDSDDFSSSETTQVSEKVHETIPITPLIIVDQKRKPKLSWRQNKTSVSIKIQLIGAADYKLIIKERFLTFSVNLNDTDYEFEFELYGVIDTKKSNHSNKGQYILVNLFKILQRNWLSLTKDCSVKKWIAYDFDSLDTSSDEEEVVDDSILKAIKDMHERVDSETDDEEFMDDAAFSYKRSDN